VVKEHHCPRFRDPEGEGGHFTLSEITDRHSQEFCEKEKEAVEKTLCLMCIGPIKEIRERELRSEGDSIIFKNLSTGQKGKQFGSFLQYGQNKTA